MIEACRLRRAVRRLHVRLGYDPFITVPLSDLCTGLLPMPESGAWVKPVRQFRDAAQISRALARWNIAIVFINSSDTVTLRRTPRGFLCPIQLAGPMRSATHFAS